MSCPNKLEKCEYVCALVYACICTCPGVIVCPFGMHMCRVCMCACIVVCLNFGSVF